MEKFVYYTELYNIYAFLLTDKQREISDLYFNENLSLSEIADNKKVSKSYVGKIVNNTIKKLEYYESNLKHLELLQKTREI